MAEQTHSTLGIIAGGCAQAMSSTPFLGAPVSASAKGGSTFRSSLAVHVLAVLHGRMSRLLSVMGLSAGVVALAFSLCNTHDVAIAMTWGMVSLCGFGLPLLCVLYSMDTRRGSSQNESTVGDLTDLQ